MKIVAMVRFNDSWAYVFDEPASLKYRQEVHGGRTYLIGQDGPFYDFLGFEKATGSFKAFAGREFRLTMNDGSVRTIKDDWWSCGSPIGDMVKITYNTVENLKRCYVFQGGYCDKVILEEMFSEYENRTSKPYGHRAGGYRYDYYDYQKVIKFDDERSRYWAKERYLKQANKHLIKNVKEWAATAKAKPRIRVPAVTERIAS